MPLDALGSLRRLKLGINYQFDVSFWEKTKAVIEKGAKNIREENRRSIAQTKINSELFVVPHAD